MPPYPHRAGARAALLLSILAATACGPEPLDDHEPSIQAALDGAVARLESLAFVPLGRTALGSAIDVGVDVDLLVDRYELTEGDWEELFGDENPIPSAFLGLLPERGGPNQPGSWATDIPVVGMTLHEARRAAGLRGMRLPTVEEWMWCAVGPRARRFPAGHQQRGLANTLELGLARTTPVGAFESGRTPETAIFDMLGNVWEWTEPPPLRGGWTTINADAWPVSGGATAPVWVMGGSYLTRSKVLYSRDRVTLALATTQGYRASDLGLRCVADASLYLAALPASTDLDRNMRRRLEAVGQRWGTRAVTLLGALAEADPDNGWVASLLEGAAPGATR